MKVQLTISPPPGLSVDPEVRVLTLQVGVQGPPGAQGPVGEAGPPGADSTVPGPQGEQGPPGGVGPQGLKGDPGETGPEGPQGPQGVKGDRGDSGPPGEQGPAGVQGDAGPQGAQGVQGPPGVDGADGVGVPAGGATGQVLAKASGADHDTEWVNQGGGGIAPLDGMVIVKHGAVAGTARPTAGVAYWLGSVAPTNRQLGDFWLETGAYD